VATLTFLQFRSGLFWNVRVKATLENQKFAGVLLVLTFAKMPAATGYECQHQDTSLCRILRAPHHKSGRQAADPAKRNFIPGDTLAFCGCVVEKCRNETT
jgi:hypothetical protein